MEKKSYSEDEKQLDDDFERLELLVYVAVFLAGFLVGYVAGLAS